MALAGMAAGAVAPACASIGSPPGGPERTTPPVLVNVRPESGAVNVRVEHAVFEFDVVVNDRSGGGGGIESLFLVSPSEGAPRVRWRRSRVEVRPRDDFRANTAYSIMILPGIADLQGNTTTTGRTIVFSTGPAIPPYQVMGRVFDWSNQRVAPNAFVEVMRVPDSLRYVGTADSTGQFVVGPLEEATYVVRAIMDNNRNRGADPGEPWDSLQVTVRGTSPFLELLAAQRDTTPPRLLTVTIPDTVTIVASFDRPLSGDVPLTPASFHVLDADSTRLRVARVLTRAQADAERAARDSAARRDSAAADTTRRDTTTRARPQTIPPRAAVPLATADLRPSRPAPPRDIVILLDTINPLRRGASYRVVAVNVSGLLGGARTSDRVFTVPAAVPRDTAAAARRDTTATAPAASPARRP
jgi:hypothetical protein